MRQAHLQGIKTTATMMFGLVETLQERLDHLGKIRALQDETRGFTAFIPWTFQPGNTLVESKEASSVEYLKFLALEPKIRIEGLGMVGVENTFRVTEKGGVCITGDDFEAVSV